MLRYFLRQNSYSVYELELTAGKNITELLEINFQ